MNYSEKLPKIADEKKFYRSECNVIAPETQFSQFQGQIWAKNMTEIRKEFSCSACIVICFRHKLNCQKEIKRFVEMCRGGWVPYRVYLKRLDVFRE